MTETNKMYNTFLGDLHCVVLKQVIHFHRQTLTMNECIIGSRKHGRVEGHFLSKLPEHSTT